MPEVIFLLLLGRIFCYITLIDRRNVNNVGMDAKDIVAAKRASLTQRSEAVNARGTQRFKEIGEKEALMGAFVSRDASLEAMLSNIRNVIRSGVLYSPVPEGIEIPASLPRSLQKNEQLIS